MDMYNLKRTLHNQAYFYIFVFVLLVLFVFSSPLFADSSNKLVPPTIPPKLALTADEQTWLAKHPTITMGGCLCPPMNFIDKQGKPTGMGPDYLALIAARLGITINMVSGDWTEMQALAKAHKLDGLTVLMKNRERQAYLDFAGPYTQEEYAILVNKESQGIATLDDLSGKQVGIMAGDYSEDFLNTNHPEIDLFLYQSYEQAVHALVNREVEAIVGSLAIITYFIDKQLITGLKVAGLPETIANDVYAAVRKDWPQFTAILNKAFASLSVQEHQKIRRKWIGLYPAAEKIPQLALTLKQKEWLTQQDKVRVRVFDLPPYMIVKAGHPPEGIAIEHLNLIAQRTGIKFSYEEVEQPFSELLESFKQGQALDLIPLIVNRQERQEYILFSDSYLESPTVIAVRSSQGYLIDIQGLSGKLVGVLKAGNLHNLLSAHYPDIRLALYDSNELALEALASGKVDAFVGSLTTAACIIKKRGFSNIDIVASSSLGSEHYTMGNRKNSPELTAIINLALASISEKEKTAIRNKHVALQYQVQGMALLEVLMWLSIVICIALIIVLFFVTWNRSLRKLVNSRTIALQHEVLVREQAQKIARLGYWEWDLVNDKINWSKEVYQIFDLPSDTVLTHQKVLQSIHPDDHQTMEENNSKWLQSQNGGSYEYRVIKADGSLRSVYAIAEVECNNKGEVIRLFGTLQDVSERKEIEQKLINYQQRLKSLALQLALVEEQERRRIAADLHDNVGQSLAFTRLQLAAVLKRLPDEEKTTELIRGSSQSLLTAIQDTRHLIFELSSPTLNELGLVAAITEWKEQYYQLSHHLEIEVIDRLEVGFVSLDLRAILFRNVRELLINVIKHAKATAVVITLEERSGRYLITVKDDGIGFMVEEQAGGVSVDSGFGLFSIQERMMDIGGELLINSKPQEGSTIVLTLPVIETGKK